ncbi:MAG: hypothetical protein WEC59_09625 [Salibacteraceae bacterium]
MRKGVFLILILLFPSIVYMLFSLGEHRVERLSMLGDYSVDDAGDTSYSVIPDLHLIGSDGKEFSLRDFEGKPIVLDIFENPCLEPCRKKGVTLVNYFNDFGEEEKWVIISVANDVSIDLDELRTLHKEHMPEMKNWLFAKPASLSSFDSFVEYTYVKTGNIATVNDLPSDDYLLIDQQGVMRAFFDSRIYNENRKMGDAIKLLLKEPFLTWKDEKK